MRQRRRGGAARRQHEMQYRLLFENALVGIFRSTLEGHFTAVNSALMRMLDYSSAEEVLALKLPEDLYADPTQRAHLRVTYEPGGMLVGAELLWKKKSGEPLIVSLYARAIHDTQGRLVHYEGLVLDVTERRRVEEALRLSEERYRLVSQSISDYAFSFRVDEAGTLFIEWLTESFEKITGYSVTEMLEQPRPLRKYIHPEDLSRVLHTVRSLEPGKLVTYQFRIITKRGEVRWLESHAQAVADTAGNLVRLYGAARDVTERNEAAEALYRETQISRGQTAVLAQTLQALTAMPMLDTFLGQILTAIIQQLGASSATLAFYEKAQDRFILHMGYAHGQILSTVELRDLAALYPPPAHRNVLWRELVRTRLPIVVEDVGQDPRITYREAWLTQKVKTLLALPIIVADETIGWLSLCNTEPRRYRPEEIELAQALSHQVALAVHLERLAERGRQAAVLEERNRLAREIHDTLAQGLTGIVLQLEAAKRILTTAPQRAQTRLNEAWVLARESLAEARRSVMALRPHALEREDLPTALAHLVTQAAAGTQTQVIFHLHGSPRSLPAEVESNLLRVGQEALHNARAHAEAREITLDLTFGVHKVQMRIQDNGRGFNVHGPAADAGFGLTSMRERAERIGGRLSLTSQPGQGTEVIVTVPNASFGDAERKP